MPIMRPSTQGIVDARNISVLKRVTNKEEDKMSGETTAINPMTALYLIISIIISLTLAYKHDKGKKLDAWSYPPLHKSLSAGIFY